MSRGPGRWQRALLTALHEAPDVAPNGRRHLYVRSWLESELGRQPTAAEYSAVHRAARGLVRAGLARTWNPKYVGDLEPLPDAKVRPTVQTYSDPPGVVTGLDGKLYRPKR